MIVYKCKMCNGNLDMSTPKRIVKCNYCDTYQTVPSLLDETKVDMVNRANSYRQNGEFDRAASIYEQILREDATDPEIHWSLVLCKFGIEYVEDPTTRRMMPTINRTQSRSILQDPDYRNAIVIAEPDTKQYYMAEADKIDKIQKSIWRIAQDTEDYDVFISYKELGPDGQRTNSSMIAQRLYDQLTIFGIKTFFSRVSLADKLGSEFEPYIFSALNSAKVMLVVGTNKEEFHAPWVKNEWSRFRTLAMTDSLKRLIPCVQGVDIEDLPDDLQPYQAQDMNKENAEHDILNAIKKIISKLKANESPYNETDTEKLKKNGDVYLSLKDFGRSEMIYKELCSRDPGDYKVWWGRILAVTKDLTDTDALKKHRQDLKFWMDHIKRLTPPKVYDDLSVKYTSYLKNIADLSVIEEIENAKKIRDQRSEEAERLKAKLEQNTNWKSSQEVLLESKISELEIQLKDTTKDVKKVRNTVESLTTHKIIFEILTFIFLCVCVVGITRFSLPPFTVGTFMALIFAVLTYIDFERLRVIKAQVLQKELLLDTTREKLTKLKDRLEAERKISASEKESLKDTLLKYNDIVANANLYLTYKSDSISNLLFAIMSSEFGKEEPIDQDLFQIRQLAFQAVS